MYDERFVPDMNHPANPVTCVESGACTGIIFNGAVVVAMLDFLEDIDSICEIDGKILIEFGTRWESWG